MTFVVIGGAPQRLEKTVIKDSDGIWHIDTEFVTSRPEWYKRTGSCEVNGILYHTYELR